jgi:hypothetical protein
VISTGAETPESPVGPSWRLRRLHFPTTPATAPTQPVLRSDEGHRRTEEKSMNPWSLIRNIRASACLRNRRCWRLPAQALLAMLVLSILEGPAWAGPCTKEILKMQADLDALAASRPGKGTAHQSIAAQRHHQPTPATVARGEQQARADELHDRAALARARAADAKGDSTGCKRALAEARRAPPKD